MNVRAGFVTVQVRVPSLRYLDELVRLECGPELLATGFFPNAKEVTESFAAFSAVRKHLKFLPIDDPAVMVVVVGDGRSPRTGATFAFRTKWQCVSIDPALQFEKYFGVQRLVCIQRNTHEVELNSVLPKVVVLVHAHTTIPRHIQNVRAVVSIPCCRPDGGEAPDLEYQDWGIWSERRTVRIWKPSA